jgi:hypothetical protein
MLAVIGPTSAALNTAIAISTCSTSTALHQYEASSLPICFDSLESSHHNLAKIAQRLPVQWTFAQLGREQFDG